MDEEILRKILIARAKAQNKKPFTVSVTGSSMEPILYEGDHVTVLPQVAYEVGDILVYYYKQEGLLVHRLLKIQDSRYFCKGDNALRLEDVDRDAIVGAVQLEQDPHRTREFIQLSLDVNAVFCHTGYNRARTLQSETYQLYHTKYLRKEDMA